MEHLLGEAAALWRATGAGEDLRLIGGLAVHLHVGISARLTHDIDVAAVTESARTALLSHLQLSGYEVASTGAWWRAASPGEPRILIDIARHPVVSPRTYDEISLCAPVKCCDVGDTGVIVAGADDLALLKLMAHRGQDQIDLLLLASTGMLDPQRIASAAAADDVERRISEGAHELRLSLQTGAMKALSDELLDRAPSASEVASLTRFLDDLEKEGL